MPALQRYIHEKKMLDTKRPFNLVEISIKACYQARQMRNGNEVCTRLFVCFESEGDQPKEETCSQVNKLLLVVGQGDANGLAQPHLWSPSPQPVVPQPVVPQLYLSSDVRPPNSPELCWAGVLTCRLVFSD